jgi:hypothetical protein
VNHDTVNNDPANHDPANNGPLNDDPANNDPVNHGPANNDTANPLPKGVRLIAALFALSAIYLAIVGSLILLRPGTVPISAGAPLLFGLESAGPSMYVRRALSGFSVAWGLVELNNLVRHAAVLISITGIAWLAPSVSHATIVHPQALLFGGPGIVVRVLVAWYLSRAEVAGAFHHPRAGD